MGKACVLVEKSAEKRRCPRWGAMLWGSLLPSLPQTPQESHYRQFSFLNVRRKAVIICLAEAGQARTLTGPVRVSFHLSHTLLEADSSLPLPLQGQLSLHCRNMPQLAPPLPHPLALPLWIIEMVLHTHTYICSCSAQWIKPVPARGSSNLLPWAGVL